jgi:carbonic anhydrase
MIEGLDKARFPELAHWIGDTAVAAEAARGEWSVDRWQEAVEENVLAQLANLTTYPQVRSRLDSGKVTLHGWVYDIRGALRVYDEARGEFVDQ